MAQKTGYEVEGQVATNLKELGAILGVKNIKKKDLEGDGKYADQVNLVDLEDEEWEEGYPQKAEAKEEEAHPMEKPEVNEDEVYTALSEDDIENLKTVSKKEIAESFPEFEHLDELKDFIRDLDMPTLEYLAKGLELQWKPTHHANIHRMRVAMELQRHFFPEKFAPKEKKKTSKYGDFSTEELFKMAEENDVKYKKTGNEHIDRMKVIMKLKESGNLPG